MPKKRYFMEEREITELAFFQVSAKKVWGSQPVCKVVGVCVGHAVERQYSSQLGGGGAVAGAEKEQW